MTTIIYIPLDERPATLGFPQALLKSNSEIKLLVPPANFLGYKKKPAAVEELWTWLETEAAQATHLLCSLDMLLYGGIVPSRLHSFTKEECEAKLQRLVSLKQKHPKLAIYAFNLIMRVPAYSSSDEEPDYYADFGKEIFYWGWLQDKIGRGQGGDTEQTELARIKEAIPEEVQRDYLGRRAVNHLVNTRALSLAKDGVLDFLVIPLDDCAEYGFSAAEQRSLLEQVEKDTLQDQVYIYPGADEVGSTLLCRIYNQLKGEKPRVFVRYSSTIGPFIIPRYEDRPLGESIKSQITVCGGVLVDNSLEADLILMVNSPTLNNGTMQEAAEAVSSKDTSYYSFRNLREFTESIAYYLSQGKKVAVADVAFGNGADHEFMQILGKRGLLGKIYSYGAWNTPGITIGTVLAHALAKIGSQVTQDQVDHFTLDRYLEDWGYQVLVRTYLRENAEDLGITYFDLKDQAAQISTTAQTMLQEFIERYLAEFKDTYRIEKVYFPWNRLFEIGFTTKIQDREPF